MSLSKYRQIKPILYICPEIKKKKRTRVWGVPALNTIKLAPVKIHIKK